ncbi:hypothetical protein L7F22_066922 [Adiantum nelumboides]|nr:hypothetical protein [Adiantum nelumboides]
MAAAVEEEQSTVPLPVSPPAPATEGATYKTLTPSAGMITACPFECKQEICVVYKIAAVRAEEALPISPETATDATSGSSISSGLASAPVDRGKSIDRDEALAKLNQDRTVSHVRAWEEMEKAKAANRFTKTIAKINAWENAQKAAAEASLKKAEEALEKKRAAYVEKMKNKIAVVHRSAEEQRAMAEARRGEEFVKAEELAAKYRAHGKAPKKFLCFRA